MLNKLLLLFLIFVFSCTTKSQKEKLPKLPTKFTSEVIGVKDGDTIEILYISYSTKIPIVIRFEHIDCPEKKQAYGTSAKKTLSDLIYGKSVKVIHNNVKDRYGRLIAEIFFGDQNINKLMVEKGMAWHYLKHSKDKSYTELEKKARKNKIGLWADTNPIAPCEYRNK